MAAIGSSSSNYDLYRAMVPFVTQIDKLLETEKYEEYSYLSLAALKCHNAPFLKAALLRGISPFAKIPEAYFATFPVVSPQFIGDLHDFADNINDHRSNYERFVNPKRLTEKKTVSASAATPYEITPVTFLPRERLSKNAPFAKTATPCKVVRVMKTQNLSALIHEKPVTAIKTPRLKKPQNLLSSIQETAGEAVSLTSANRIAGEVQIQKPRTRVKAGKENAVPATTAAANFALAVSTDPTLYDQAMRIKRSLIVSAVSKARPLATPPENRQPLTQLNYFSATIAKK